MIFFYALLTVVTGLTLYALRVPGTVLRRVGVGFLFVLALASAALSVVSALGTPKPVGLETLSAEKAKVLASRMREGVAIYLWLLLPGETEPRYYVIPWDQKLAEALHKALQEKGERDELGMELPFERSWDKRERKFYPIPQPKMPEKEMPEEDKPFNQEQRI